ncbi:hypothetical protein ACEPAF_1655 [Sanghuangporus sanghuang]
MKFHKEPYKSMYQLYGLGDINQGKKIPACGTQHIVSFDCSEASGGGDVAEGRKELQGKVTESTVVSPALAGFLERLPPSDNVHVHVVPWVDPDAEESKKASHVSRLLRVLKSEKRRCVESQIHRQYEHLVKNYKVNSRVGRNGTRDGIYLFGDAEGALAAIAVTRIVANVGILQPAYREDEVDKAIDIGQRGPREEWEDYMINYSVFRFPSRTTWTLD